MHYKELADVYSAVEGTSKRILKTYHVAELLKRTPEKDTKAVMLLLQGKVFPDWDSRKVGVAARLILKAISRSTGTSEIAIEELWRDLGDLGLVAEELVKSKVQVTLGQIDLSVDKVYSNLVKLAELTGSGTVNRKVQLVSELLTSASPVEAKYIVRSVLEDLRVGIGEGSMRDAIVWAYFPKIWGVHIKCANDECGSYGHVGYENGKKCLGCAEAVSVKERPQMPEIKSLEDLPKALADGAEWLFPGVNEDGEDSARSVYQYLLDSVQHAYDILTEFSEVAFIARKDGLEGLRAVNLAPGRPLKVMLAQKSAGIADAFERVGRPAALEYKYDGFRMQVHKSGKDVRIFTRRLEEVTAQFPEVVEFFTHLDCPDVILDGEAVGYEPSSGKYLPFQHISQRIRRKHGIDQMAEKLPVELNLFDIMFIDGENMLEKAYNKRREALEKLITPEKGKVVIAKKIVTDSDAEADKFYRESLAKGNEGIMAKSLKSVYKPGSRVGFMVKIKPTMETLDLVITGAEWGEGKRANWLTSFTLSCLDDGEYVQIGKVGTGIKELEGEGVTFEQLTELLKPEIVEQKGRSVVLKPSVVVEIKYEEIQRSPTYSSGYALRFPRVSRIRDDLSPDEASDIDLVEEFYDTQ